MGNYNEELQRLQNQIARKRQLDAMIVELKSQCAALARQVEELEGIRKKEQLDVDRLEGRGFAAFFYQAAGRLDEKLDQERREAYAASVKYGAAVRELCGLREELSRREAEWQELAGCEERYQAVMAEKTAAVRRSGGAAAEELLRIEERLAYLRSQEGELLEAAAAGQAALSTAGQILSSLGSAAGFGTLDLLGGGMLADFAKHSHLDAAQDCIELLQAQLRSFQTELADVTIRMDAQVRVEGFLRFADYFFDGVFADWAVMDKISRSQRQIQAVRDQIEGVLTRLDAMLCAVEEEKQQTAARRDALVAETLI